MRPLGRLYGPSIALVLAMVAVMPARANHSSETRRYVAGPGDAIVLLCSESPSLGGACFDVPGAHGSVRVRLNDRSGLPIGGAYRFEAADGSSLTRGSLCAQATVAIPAGATMVTVFVDSVRSPADCPVNTGSLPGTGTSGDITVTWLSGIFPSGDAG